MYQTLQIRKMKTKIPQICPFLISDSVNTLYVTFNWWLEIKQLLLSYEGVQRDCADLEKLEIPAVGLIVHN